MAGPVIHWDEVPKHPVQRGPLEAVFSNLGAALGMVRVGLRREEIAAGKRPLPPHLHTAEEEMYYVLGGSGRSWRDGEAGAVRAGDCVVHPPGRGAHALVAGPDGLDVLAFGDHLTAEVAYLPRAKVAWLGPTWVTMGEGEHPWDRDAAAGDLPIPEEPTERPSSIVNVEDVGSLPIRRGKADMTCRNLGKAAGARQTGLQHVVLAPDAEGFPPHSHSAEEELFVVLEGGGLLLTQESPVALSMQGEELAGWHPHEHPLRAGSVIGMPAGTGVAHAFRAGPEGMTYLAYGTRLPNDILWYPRSGKVWFKGIGVIGRLEPLPYWHGEEEG